MTTDKELLSWKSRAAEAEQKRVAAENRALKYSVHLDTTRKALEEAATILDKLSKADIYDGAGMLVSKDENRRHKFSKREFAYAANIMKGARASTNPGMELGASMNKIEEIKATDAPQNPKTDDWFMDKNQVLHWYYLGRWHPPLEGEDE